MSIHPAALALADLAAQMRPDWQRAHFEGAMAAAASAGWSWPRTCKQAFALLLDENATPHDLAAATRDPLRHEPPGDYAHGGEEARAEMERSLRQAAEQRAYRDIAEGGDAA